MKLTPLFYCWLLLVTSQSLSAQANEQIWITFRVDVDKLRVRAAPDKNAKVVAELPEDTQLKYLNATAGNWDEIELRGKKHKARWYKVEEVGTPVTGWVYGGAVVLSSVYFEGPESFPALRHDFVEMEQIADEIYDKAKAAFADQMVYDTIDYQLNDSTILLKFDDGSKKELTGSSEPEESYANYTYLGRLPGAHQYFVQAIYYEDMDITMYDTRNGAELSIDFGEIPRLSPDSRWLAAGFQNPYEEDSGIQLYINLPKKVAEFARITLPGSDCTDLCWDNSGNLYFKYRLWSEERNVVKYYRLKIPER